MRIVCPNLTQSKGKALAATLSDDSDSDGESKDEERKDEERKLLDYVQGQIQEFHSGWTPFFFWFQTLIHIIQKKGQKPKYIVYINKK